MRKSNYLNLYDDDHIKNDEKIEYLKEVEETALEKKESFYKYINAPT